MSEEATVIMTGKKPEQTISNMSGDDLTRNKTDDLAHTMKKMLLERHASGNYKAWVFTFTSRRGW